MNSGEQEILYRYIAKKALQDLRNREEIDDALLHYLNSFPLKNYCRAEIYDGDKDLLKRNRLTRQVTSFPPIGIESAPPIQK